MILIESNHVSLNGHYCATATEWLVGHYCHVELKFRSAGVLWGKTGEPKEKFSKKGREPSANSIHRTPGFEPGPHW